jgi:hypothetical protein
MDNGYIIYMLMSVIALSLLLFVIIKDLNSPEDDNG